MCCAAPARRSSCRKVHAVFAANNSNHCAHLSFKPMADPKGKFKCQESAQVPVSDLFSDDELATFATFVAAEGFEPDQHWRLSPCQTQADCPAAGDPEEHPKLITGVHYTNNATCVFGTPTKRHLLFGAVAGPRLACACPPDILLGYSSVASHRCPGGGRPHSVARQG